MNRLNRSPRAIVIAGPNGAGKTTTARFLLGAAVWSRIARQLRIREVARSSYARGREQDAEPHRRLDLAMTRAFYAAVRLHRMHGLPLAVLDDGGVRYVDAHSIRLPDDDAPSRARADGSR